MAVITGGLVIEGSGLDAPYLNAGAPSAGTNAIQTLTIGGTPTAGTFRLGFAGETTGPITWSATNATLLANIQAALDALNGLVSTDVVAAAGTLSSGIGTITLTFGNNYARTPVSTITIASNSLTGTSPTLANATTTAGVSATGRGAAKGGQLIDTTNGIIYINTGTSLSPTWTKVGTQT